MEKRFIKIGEAAKILGVSIETMRRWESSGELVPHRKTKGGTREVERTVRQCTTYRSAKRRPSVLLMG